MPLMATATNADKGSHGPKKPHIPPGLIPGTCCDVIDAGEKPNMNGKLVRKVRFVYATAQRWDNDGTPMCVGTTLTLSLHKKATLRGLLESWEGRLFAEGEQVDLESYIGRPAYLNIVHAPDALGNVWANIKGVMALPPSIPAPSAQGYVRKSGAFTMKDDAIGLRINPAQVTKLHALCTSLGIPDDELRAVLKMYNVAEIDGRPSTKNIRDTDYDAILADVAALKKTP